MKAVGGRYSYNRGPTFFLNRGPAKSKSGPESGHMIERGANLYTPASASVTDVRDLTILTALILVNKDDCGRINDSFTVASFTV